MDATKIEVNLSEKKINLINDNCKYRKEVVLERAFDQNDTNKLKDSAPLRFFLTRKAAKNAKKETDIAEIISYLKS